MTEPRPPIWQRFDDSAAVVPAPDGGAALPNLYFDEAWYLRRYPGVRDEVLTGVWPSGFAHFRQHGHLDLSPHWLFDPGFYREQVRQARGRDLDPPADGDPYDHFLRIGQHEGLSGHRLFDPAVYAALAPFDIARRIRQDGPFTTLLLHLHAGGTEPAVSLLFDPAWYLRTYPAVAAEVAAGRWRGALHHYLTNDTPTAFDPSSRFSEHAYLTNCPDVAAAIAAGGFRNGFDHFLRHGRAEGRFFAPAGTDPFAVEPAAGVPPTTNFPLRTRAFDAVTLLPCQADPVRTGEFTFGVLDRNGAMIEAFRHPWIGPRPHAGTLPLAPGSFLYGGVLMNHFGHVLRDALASLWLLRERPDLPVLWHWLDLPIAHAQWPGWLEALWRILGLERHRHHHIVAPVAVERLILPDPGLVAPNVLHPKQAEALAARPCAAPWVGNRVWLSRRGLPDHFGKFAGESEVEARLLDRGWAVVCPEERPVGEQIDVFATAGVVAGTIGSAFHAVLMCAAPRAALVLVHRPGVEHTYYDAVARARGLRQSYVAPDLKPAGAFHPWAHFDLADPQPAGRCRMRGRGSRVRRLNRAPRH